MKKLGFRSYHQKRKDEREKLGKKKTVFDFLAKEKIRETLLSSLISNSNFLNCFVTKIHQLN